MSSRDQLVIKVEQIKQMTTTNRSHHGHASSSPIQKNELQGFAAVSCWTKSNAVSTKYESGRRHTLSNAEDQQKSPGAYYYSQIPYRRSISNGGWMTLDWKTQCILFSSTWGMRGAAIYTLWKQLLCWQERPNAWVQTCTNIAPRRHLLISPFDQQQIRCS